MGVLAPRGPLWAHAALSIYHSLFLLSLPKPAGTCLNSSNNKPLLFHFITPYTERSGVGVYVGVPAMSSGGGKRIVCSSSMVVVFILIMFVLQIAGAIRILPGTTKGDVTGAGTGNNTAGDDKKSLKEDLIHKYFHGRAFNFNTTTGKGFEDNKRRVPSCPDPLHN